MKYNLLFLILAICVFSCKEKPNVTTPIILGDTSTIVTESDERFLKNITEDISPKKKRTTEKQITSMMIEVDSAKSAQKLDQGNTSSPLYGFTINFAECDVVFDGLSAHAIQNSQDERKSNSVSYVKDAGELNEIALQIRGLDEARVEQRNYLKLFLQNGSEEIILNDLGKYISVWYPLAGKDFKYVSLGINSHQFFAIDNAKLKNALDRELRKKKKTNQEIQSWMDLIKKTNTYSDAPCKLKWMSAQWRITGKKSGKRVQKLIQFDMP
jgi:hypothetical protein